MDSAPQRFASNIRGATQKIVQYLTPMYEKGLISFSPQLLLYAVEMLEGQGKERLLDGFIEATYTVWDQAQRKDMDFFREHACDIFNDLPKDKVKIIVDVMEMKDPDGNKYITDEMMDEIWKYVFNFVKISIKWIHEKREPGDDGKYNSEFMNQVDVAGQAKKWNVKLPWK